MDIKNKIKVENIHSRTFKLGLTFVDLKLILASEIQAQMNIQFKAGSELSLCVHENHIEFSVYEDLLSVDAEAQP